MVISPSFANSNNTMLTLALHLLPLLNLLLSTTATQKPQSDNLTDLILLNCGASSEETSQDGRKWDGDAQSKFHASNSLTSSDSSASEQDPSVTRVPYMTARVMHSKYTYTFPVLPGPKFIRLYFYPATYSGLNKSTSFFNVTANSYTLLSNFSAYLTASALRPRAVAFFKEFIVTVRDRQQLNITFTPSPNSFAFINGIEIVSMPVNLYTSKSDNNYEFVNNENSFFFDNTTSLETLYRLNVGGGGVVADVNDTGMFRKWSDDIFYIYAGATGVTHPSDATIKYTKDTPAYIAPEVVYRTKRTMGADPHINLNYNLTWFLPIDSGFNYLVRLHFCETEEYITHENQRVFFIFINNMTAEYDADVIHWSGGTDIPVYRDYVVFVPSSGSHRKENLWLALHPNADLKPSYADAILNGLEIFKLNNSEGSLAGSNPELMESPSQPVMQPSPLQWTKGKKSSSLIIAIVGAATGGLFAFSLVLCFFVYKRKEQGKDSGTSEHKSFSYTARSSSTMVSSLPTDLCRRFSILEIIEATRNFDDENLVGSGGFGNVYKGYIGNGSIPVAIKRLGSSSMQGTREFHTEIEMLSKLRHVHLVSLIGYCDEQGEMILVYEYMPNGTLKDHLYKTKNSPLSWKHRLEICVGAARGLHYLHTGAKHAIIHRDVKTSNILLDVNWVAKVSDFGLSKTGPTSVSQTHVSTDVKGSFGYIDPEYYRRQMLTEKSDVYSFGVVLFEALCARPPVISSLPRDQVSLVEWAQNCYRRGTLDQIVDQHLKGDIAPVCLNKFGEIAVSCVRDQGTERPTMADVLGGLEFALHLQLQETGDNNIKGADDGVSLDRKESPALPQGQVVTTDDDDLFSAASGSRSTFGTDGTSANQSDTHRVRSEIVFSEIMNPMGR